MPNLIKKGEARVVTKNGEVFVNIALELNIKLDGTNLQVASVPSGASLGAQQSVAKKEESVPWEIPDFTSNKIQFGK